MLRVGATGTNKQNNNTSESKMSYGSLAHLHSHKLFEMNIPYLILFLGLKQMSQRREGSTIIKEVPVSL
jgi:hypothetical protein